MQPGKSDPRQVSALAAYTVLVVTPFVLPEILTNHFIANVITIVIVVVFVVIVVVVVVVIVVVVVVVVIVSLVTGPLPRLPLLLPHQHLVPPNSVVVVRREAATNQLKKNCLLPLKKKKTKNINYINLESINQ